MYRFLLIFLFFSPSAGAQILSEKEQAVLVDEILEERFTKLLPELMDREDIDMWVLISREYNEDPVLRTMLPSTWLNARRRTILVFHRDKEKDTLERMAIARYNVGKNIASAWNPEEEQTSGRHYSE